MALHGAYYEALDYAHAVHLADYGSSYDQLQPNNNNDDADDNSSNNSNSEYAVVVEAALDLDLDLDGMYAYALASEDNSNMNEPASAEEDTSPAEQRDDQGGLMHENQSKHAKKQSMQALEEEGDDARFDSKHSQQQQQRSSSHFQTHTNDAQHNRPSATATTTTIGTPLFWFLFNFFVVSMILVDLLVLSRVPATHTSHSATAAQALTYKTRGAYVTLHVGFFWLQ